MTSEDVVKLSVTRRTYSTTQSGRSPGPLQEEFFTAEARADYVGYHHDPEILATWTTEGDRRQSFEVTITRRDLIDMLSLIEEESSARENPLLK